MSQEILSFRYEMEKETQNLTGLAGLPVYLDLMEKMKLRGVLDGHLGVRRGGRGWTDSQVVIALILLNLAGGDAVEDIKLLEAQAETNDLYFIIQT